MALLMPTWHPVKEADMPPIDLPPDLADELPPEMVALEHKTQVGSSSQAGGIRTIVSALVNWSNSFK